MRIHELAKELGLSSKDLLDKAHELKIEAKNHMTAMDDRAVGQLRAAFALAGKTTTEKKHAPAKPEAPKAKPAPAPKLAVHPPKPVARAAKPPPPAAPPALRAKPAVPVQKPPVPVASKPAAPAPKPAAPVSAKSAAPTKPPAPAPKPPMPAPEKPETPPAPPAGKTLALRGTTVVKELAEKLGLKPNQLITELMMMNVLASINERVDIKVAQKIAEKHGFTVEHEKKPSEHRPPQKTEMEDVEQEAKAEDLVARPPIVTFLGHVDHGKTSLLDKIRNTSVAKGESGGITQHIGAYTVEMNGKRITFLDTPGHEAFTSMRARGANLTDLAVIIIAADDGVMPQTVEAIKHAQAAEVLIMVAINKMDLPAANPEKVKQQLAGMGLAPEDWGGKVICCPVSALTGKGLDLLLEMILLQAEMLDLKANPKAKPRGYVIEARLEAGMGPTANLLVMNGSLHGGDVLLCGEHWGRVRALINDHGVKVKSAGPGTPVKCLGLSGVPSPGAEFRYCASDRLAREIAEQRMAEVRAGQIVQPKRVTLSNLLEKLKENERLELRIILKTDVQGSLEAIEHALQQIKSEKAFLKIILSGVGTITANDVMLAKASEAVILGFHVAKEEGVASLAKREGVDIRLHSIIYELVDQVRDGMTGLLAPEVRQRIIGHLEIKQLFEFSKGGKVAGCEVRDGRVTSRCSARVVRKGEVIYDGSVVSLRRFQNDAPEVQEGQECGIRLDNYSDFVPGDIIEAYDVEKIPQNL